MTTTTADTLDMSRLDAPTLLPIDYEALRTAMLAKFVELWEAARIIRPDLPPYSVGSLETDPAVILNEEFAYFEMLLRSLVNEMANSLRLAKAVGTDLGHIATTYHATERLIIKAATDTTAEVDEGDEEYRARAQLSTEALAQYGLTPGSYIYRVKTLFGDRVLDVAPVRTGGGGIDLVILGRAGDGTPAPTLIGDIAAAFDGERNSQSTDIVTVRAAEIRSTPVRIVIGLRKGPDPDAVKVAAKAAVQALGDQCHLLNETLYVQALGAAAKVGPALYARVEEPSDDVIGGPYGAPWVSSIAIDTEIMVERKP